MPSVKFVVLFLYLTRVPIFRKGSKIVRMDSEQIRTRLEAWPRWSHERKTVAERSPDTSRSTILTSLAGFTTEQNKINASGK